MDLTTTQGTDDLRFLTEHSSHSIPQTRALLSQRASSIVLEARTLLPNEGSFGYQPNLDKNASLL